jgi:hypothetical protein
VGGGLGVYVNCGSEEEGFPGVGDSQEENVEIAPDPATRSTFSFHEEENVE